MRCQKTLTLLAITSIAGFAPVFAQQKTETKTRQQPARSTVGENASRSADQRTTWKDADHLLATCVAIDNQEEIAIARFVEKKLQHKDAQEFARMLIEDHGKFVKKLEQFAPEATQDGFLRENRATRERASADPLLPEGAKKPVATVIQRTAAKPNLDEPTAGDMPIDFLQLHRELAQQCLDNTQAMLTEKGKDIDECFIGLQIARHAGMKSKLQVLQRHASGELKDLLAQGEKTTTAHLEHAQKIMKQLSKSTETADAK